MRGAEWGKRGGQRKREGGGEISEALVLPDGMRLPMSAQHPLGPSLLLPPADAVAPAPGAGE